MTTSTIFSDSFSGSGAFDGHAPETPSDVTWSDGLGSLRLGAGALHSVDTYLGAVGQAQIISGFPTTGAMVSARVEFTLVTPANVSVLLDRYAFDVDLTFNGASFNARLQSTETDWQLSANGSPQTVSISPGTNYTVVWDILNGTQTLSFNGYTASSSTAFVDTSGLTSCGNLAVGDLFALLNFDCTALDAFGVDAIAPTATVSAQGLMHAYVDVEAPSPVVSAQGGGYMSAVAPTSTVLAQGGGYVAAIAPTPMISASFGASIFVTAPAATLSSTVHSSYGDNALIFTAPTATLSCYGGANASLTAPSFTLSCTATGTALATVAAQAPAATLTATGTASEVLSLAATAPMVNLVGYGGVVCSVTTPMATVTVSGTGGATVGVAVTLPMFDVVASGTAQNYGSVIVAAPMARMATGLQAYVLAPMAQLVAVGTATVAATYEAYTMNMKHAPRPRGQEDTAPVNEVTRYTNFPFTHIVRHKNSYYGVNSSGLYLLEGTTDAGTAIPYEARTHISDLDEIKLKTVVSAYFGGRLGASSTVTLYAGESTVEAYAFTTPRGAVAQNYRQKFGRGLKTRYFALGASGSAEFSIDNVAFEVATMTRRI